MRYMEPLETESGTCWGWTSSIREPVYQRQKTCDSTWIDILDVNKHSNWRDDSCLSGKKYISGNGLQFQTWSISHHLRVIFCDVIWICPSHWCGTLNFWFRAFSHLTCQLNHECVQLLIIPNQPERAMSERVLPPYPLASPPLQMNFSICHSSDDR